MKNSSEILRDLREDRDLTQSEVAKILGTTQQQYSKYENSTTEIPLRVMVMLSDFYKVSLDFLASREIPEMENLIFLNQSEKRLLTAWGKITEKQKSILLELLESMILQENG